MRELLKRLMVEEEGQGIVEYTLIIALVVMGIYAAVSLTNIPTAVSDLWTTVATDIGTAGS